MFGIQAGQKLVHPLFGTEHAIVRVCDNLRAAGRSLGVVIDTPRLETQQPLSVQVAEVVEGLEAALRLQSWWNESEEQLRVWACQVSCPSG